MSSSLLTRDGESVCVTRQKHNSSYLIYKLEKIEEYGFKFYGIFHKFEIGLNKDLCFSEQPYGPIGSAADFSGRAITTGLGKERKPIISNPGEKIITLDKPIYSFVSECDKHKLNKSLEGYFQEKRDIPYASISISAFAVGDSGDDFYLNTLFFMNGGYGILAEISALAGRDAGDCCSPEFYYEAHKAKLETNPLKLFQERDIFPGATLAELCVCSNPEITPPSSMRFSEDIEKLDILLDELFINFR